MNPESRETPEMVLKKWKHGWFNRHEFFLNLLGSITPENASEFVRAAPADVLAEIKQDVEAAPLTDQEWKQFFITDPGVIPDEEAEVLRREENEHLICRYRVGVETLRAFLSAAHKPCFPEPT